MPQVAPTTKPSTRQTPGEKVEKPGKTQKPGKGPKTIPGKRKA